MAAIINLHLGLFDGVT